MRLPTQVRGDYAVFVNGVRQREGVDYDVAGLMGTKVVTARWA